MTAANALDLKRAKASAQEAISASVFCILMLAVADSQSKCNRQPFEHTP